MLKKSMTTKFIKSFFILIVIPIFIINIALNQLYKNVLLDNYSEKVQQVMEQISIDIENELKRISLSAATISHDKDIISLVNSWSKEGNTIKKFDLSREIDSKLNYFFNFNSEVNSIIFFFEDEGYYYYKAPIGIDEGKIRSQKWYEDSLNDKGKVFNLGTLKRITSNFNNERDLSVCISPQILGNHNKIEMIYLQFRTSIFDSIYSKYKIDQNDKMLIINNEGEIIVSSDKNLVGKRGNEFSYLKNAISSEKNVFTEVVDGNKKFISTQLMWKSKWILVNIIDYKLLTKEMDDILNISIAIFIICILLFIAFSVFFFKDIIKPIKNLINKMKSAETGNFDDEIEITGNGEIRELGKSFNKMIFEIKKLIIERDLKEKEKLKEEIKALQAQINPHFIYNTLNSIRLMAMIAKVDSITNLTDSFMKLLSATFKHKSTLIPIEDEIQYLENYVEIMKVRYGDNFEFHIDISSDLKGFYIIKLILQPIVENSILHGINQIEGKGHIKVKGYIEGDNIVFEVVDNGIGMTKQQIDELLKSKKNYRRSFNNIGIMNVDKRIKLNHGDGYGLSIISEKDKYTSVKLILPAITEEEGGITSV